MMGMGLMGCGREWGGSCGAVVQGQHDWLTTSAIGNAPRKEERTVSVTGLNAMLNG